MNGWQGLVLGSLVFGVAGCGASAPQEAKPQASERVTTERVGPREVDIASFKRAHEKGAVVVDVRTDAEWAGGHVPGAIHVPLDHLQAEGAAHPLLASIPEDAPLFFICASGGRSSRATAMMAAAGRTAINVAGGTNAWVASGHPTETP